MSLGGNSHGIDQSRYIQRFDILQQWSIEAGMSAQANRAAPRHTQPSILFGLQRSQGTAPLYYSPTSLSSPISSRLDPSYSAEGCAEYSHSVICQLHASTVLLSLRKNRYTLGSIFARKTLRCQDRINAVCQRRGISHSQYCTIIFA